MHIKEWIRLANTVLSELSDMLSMQLDKLVMDLEHMNQ